MEQLRIESERCSQVSRFKRWGHKGYSVFQSLKLKITIGCLVVTYLSIATFKNASAQTEIIYVNQDQKLDEVVVSALRTPVTYSQVARVVTVMERDEINAAPVQSVQDLLEHLLNVDVRQRGNHGVQADVSIRGGSFDQTMILLNGVNITDPQTGHLSMNLPVDLESIERVEILQGPGARVFGPNAFSGAINFITGTKNKNNLKLAASVGEDGFYSLSAGTTYLTGPLKSYLALSRKASDGYIENTDFTSTNLFYQGQLTTSEGNLDLQLGYNTKGFGANSFYTPAYPNQYEENKTTFASLRFSTKGKVKFTPVVYWRRHQDRFELFRSNPASWYSSHNYHLTDVYGTNLNTSFNWALGKSSTGVEFRSENIWSNVLGEEMDEPMKVPGETGAFFTKQHTRTNLSYFLEHNIYFDRLTISAGIMANWNSDLGRSFNFYPGVDLSYQLKGNLKWYASLNHSLRMPTFTDLYYAGPTNIGNADLEPEEATTWESGFKFNNHLFRAHASIFYRKGTNMIDWVKQNAEDKWQSQNLTEINTLGLEFSTQLYPRVIWSEDFPLKSLKMTYGYLNMDKSSDEFISQYVLDNLKHKLSLTADHVIWGDLGASWSVSYQDREGGYLYYDKANSTYGEERSYSPFWLMDGRIYYQRPDYTLYAEASNLLDKDYYDRGNITQPGRWLRVGVKVNLDL
ncbi:MAG: TonB-dependent receptor [Labilibaculum sp.]|nr:TonB-dependent receptor [Labilibaculum sp.]MBI9060085.1 TonB-dependent receptor [Labilibaculum sp.]